METINISMTWENTLPTLLVLFENGDRDYAFQQLKRMAWLADNAFSPLEISLYPMKADDSLADTWDEVAYYDVDLRPEGSDPIVEFENLTEEQAVKKMEELEEQFPHVGINDLRGLLSLS